MKIRGMEVVGDKLTKKEIDKILLNLWHLKNPKRPGVRITKAGVAILKTLRQSNDEMQARRAKQKSPQADWTEDDVIRTITGRMMSYPMPGRDGLKKLRKKFKTQPTKCLGTSRKKCPNPKCKNGKVKIWLGDYGKKKELLCIRCGWTTRAVKTDANGFRE